MDMKISRKRSREADLTDCTDCLPLSKRINSLTIDTSHFPVPSEGLFHVNIDQNQSCNITPQDWQTPTQSPEYLTSSNFSHQSHNQVPHYHTSDWSSQCNGHNNDLNPQTVPHHTHNNFVHTSPPQPSHTDSSNSHSSWVSSLKYNHDNTSSEYYVNNRLLFNLYVERISRTGQAPANPY